MAAAAAAAPLYTMQAYFEGKMSVEEFARADDEKPTVAHNDFDETLPVIDIAVLKSGAPEARRALATRMLEAARSWGFFKIVNHGVPLQVVNSFPLPKNMVYQFNLFTTTCIKLQFQSHCGHVQL